MTYARLGYLSCSRQCRKAPYYFIYLYVWYTGPLSCMNRNGCVQMCFDMFKRIQTYPYAISGLSFLFGLIFEYWLRIILLDQSILKPNCQLIVWCVYVRTNSCINKYDILSLYNFINIVLPFSHLKSQVYHGILRFYIKGYNTMINYYCLRTTYTLKPKIIQKINNIKNRDNLKELFSTLLTAHIMMQ